MISGDIMGLTPPQALKVEHEEIHQELAKIASLTGPIGEAAREVSMVLQPHFEKEEAFALPPLDILPQLAQGVVTPEMEAVLPLVQRLRSEWDHLMADHKVIIAALDRLIEEATAADKLEYVQFAERLIHHMLIEETVLYPTAFLIGDYLSESQGD